MIRPAHCAWESWVLQAAIPAPTCREGGWRPRCTRGQSPLFPMVSLMIWHAPSMSVLALLACRSLEGAWRISQHAYSDLLQSILWRNILGNFNSSVLVYTCSHDCIADYQSAIPDRVGALEADILRRQSTIIAFISGQLGSKCSRESLSRTAMTSLGSLRWHITM